MFFIGATGQLLTLILTVCLPLIFFVTQPAKAHDEIALISYKPGNTEVTAYNESFSEQVTFELAALDSEQRIIEYPLWLLEKSAFPDIVFFHAQLIPSNQSNKAPPVIYC